MASSNDMAFIAVPIAMAVFAVLFNNGIVTSIFATIASLAVAVAATAAIQIVGGFQLFGSGVDVKDFSIKLTFTTTFLTVFYASNVLAGLNLFLSIPWGFGLIMLGVFTTMYVFGMFGITTGS